ncbi:hypothetical protein JCM8547_005848 [Rhodosporidiobolus lusitaniae]
MSPIGSGRSDRGTYYVGLLDANTNTFTALDPSGEYALAITSSPTSGLYVAVQGIIVNVSDGEITTTTAAAPTSAAITITTTTLQTTTLAITNEPSQRRITWTETETLTDCGDLDVCVTHEHHYGYTRTYSGGVSTISSTYITAIRAAATACGNGGNNEDTRWNSSPVSLGTPGWVVVTAVPILAAQ